MVQQKHGVVMKVFYGLDQAYNHEIGQYVLADTFSLVLTLVNLEGEVFHLTFSDEEAKRVIEICEISHVNDFLEMPLSVIWIRDRIQE